MFSNYKLRWPIKKKIYKWPWYAGYIKWPESADTLAIVVTDTKIVRITKEEVVIEENNGGYLNQVLERIKL